MALEKLPLIGLYFGILSKDSGHVRWKNREIDRKIVSYGYLPEERGIYPRVTVLDQLLYFATLRGMKHSHANKVIRDWCDIFDITDYLNTPSEQLSKGNQQKVQLLSSIIHTPDLLILDEPFSGLDPVNTHVLKKILQMLVNNRYLYNTICSSNVYS